MSISFVKISPMKISIRPACLSDLNAIHTLLADCDLPTIGLRENINKFLVATDGTNLLGCAGFESYPPAALFRSLAVCPQARGKGVASTVIEALIKRAHDDGISEVFALASSAESYLFRFGFSEVDKQRVPDSVRLSNEFQSLYPNSSAVIGLYVGA